MFNLFEKHPNLFAAVSERKHGSMKIFSDKSESRDILENRKKFLENHGINPSDLVSAGLCHGKNVEQSFLKDGGSILENTDGLFTKEKGIFLSVTVADCLPIFLFDPEKEIIALLHAGWRGLEKNIISEAVFKMKEAGSSIENILVGIGPAIGKCHYEVGKEVAEKFARFGKEAKEEKNGKIFLDLKRIAELQLIESGVPAKNIEKSGECTFCEEEKYFSFRRDAEGDIGKLEAMIAVIGIREQKNVFKKLIY